MSDVKVVTAEDGRSQFWLSAGAGPAARIEGFDPDRDVLVLDRPDLTRDNLGFTEQEGATVIAVGDEDLAALVGVRAADMNPAPVARRLHEALQAGDVPGVVDLLGPDVVWEAPGPVDILPWAGRWIGPDGVATAALIPLGHPAKGFPKKLARRPLEDTCFGDAWDAPVFA